MPRHSQGQSTLRPDLGGVVWEYALEASQRGYIASLVLPIFRTALQSGSFPIIPASSLLKLMETRRADRAAYERIDWLFDDDKFATSRYGLEAPIDDRERDLHEGMYSGLDLDQITSMIVTDMLLRDFEKRVADLIMNTGNFFNSPVANPWNVKADADPRADIKAGRKRIRETTGLKPNALILSEDTFEYIEECDAFVEHVKYTKAVLTESRETNMALVANYLRVPNLIVGNALYNSSKKKNTVQSVSMWPDDKAMLCIIGTQPQNLKEPCIGRTFLWDEFGQQILFADQYREEQTESDIVRVKMETDEKLMMPSCGYLLTGTYSA